MELSRELVGLVQVQRQLRVTCLDTLQICVLLGKERSHPLAHIFDIDLGGLLGRLPARQALALVSVDLCQQRIGRLVNVLERCLSRYVDLSAQGVAMLSNSHFGLDRRQSSRSVAPEGIVASESSWMKSDKNQIVLNLIMNYLNSIILTY